MNDKDRGMEKRAVIEEGRTPPERVEKRAGDATPPLESHLTKRLADAKPTPKRPG